MIIKSEEVKDILKSWRLSAFREFYTFCYSMSDDGTLFIYSDNIGPLKGYKNTVANYYINKLKGACGDIKTVEFVEVQAPCINTCSLIRS